MSRSLWIGALALLNAVLFGLIFSIGQPKLDPPAATPPTRVAVAQPATTPDLPEMLPADWPAEESQAGKTARAAGQPASPVTTADLNPVASLELTTEFAESVRRARAAGIDEVLLAHAIVAQFHRQTEAMLYGPGENNLTETQRDQARAEAVVGLLGETAYRGWQRSDYALSHGLAGSGITDSELDAVLRLTAERDKRLAELWQGGKLEANNYRQAAEQLNEDYRRRLARSLGAERVRQLGL